MTSVKAEDVEALIQVFDESEWEELRVVLDGFEIYLSKDPAGRGRGPNPLSASTQAPAVATMPIGTPAAVASQTNQRMAIPDGMVAVRAPNLGTFYRSPRPGAPPYVSIGQKVEPNTEMCLIEVMKLFTSVRAGVGGTVREICVEDAQLVEFDQPLFLMEPCL
jgi:acetyl-CoA carboxylase biotin carboxyl carrier protein